MCIFLPDGQRIIPGMEAEPGGQELTEEASLERKVVWDQRNNAPI